MKCGKHKVYKDKDKGDILIIKNGRVIFIIDDSGPLSFAPEKTLAIWDKEPLLKVKKYKSR